MPKRGRCRDPDYHYDTSDQCWFDYLIGPQTDRPTQKRQSSDTAPIVKFMKKRRRIARNDANNVARNVANNANKFNEFIESDNKSNADSLSNYKPPSSVAIDSALRGLNYQIAITTLNIPSNRCNIIFRTIQDILEQEWKYNPNSAYGQAMPFMYLPYALVHGIYTTDNSTNNTILNKAINKYKGSNNTDIATSFLKLTDDVLTNYITTSLYMYDNYILPATEDNDRQGGRFVEFMIHTVFKYHIAAYELLNNFENNGSDMSNISNVTLNTINRTADTLHTTAQSLLNNNQLYVPIESYSFILVNTAKLLSIKKYQKNRTLRAIRDPWFIASGDVLDNVVSANAEIDPSSLVRSMYVLYSPLPTLVGSIEGDLWCTRGRDIEIIECKRYKNFSDANKFHAFCQLFLYCNGYRKSIFEHVSRGPDITLTVIDITRKTEYKIKFMDLENLLAKVKIRGSNESVSSYLASDYIFGNSRSNISNYIVKVDKRKKNYL